MTAEERQAVIVKWMAVGYAGLTPAERQVIAFSVTVGGCHGCA